MLASVAGRWTAVRGNVERGLASDGLRKIVANTGWLIGERGVTMLVTLFVHVWLARYLGPSQFGILSYAVSFVGLFGTFTYLGLSGVVTRDLVTDPKMKDEILGTVFVLKLFGGLLAIACILSFLSLRDTEDVTRIVVAIIALGLLFDSSRVIELWFGSRVESRYAVVATAAARLTGALVTVALIIASASLVAFAAVHAIQSVAAGLGLFAIYKLRHNLVRTWRFSFSRARRLLAQSWPLALSSVGAVIYLKIDQVMIGEMLGAEAVGTYAVAARLSEVWYFVPAAIAASLFPKIIRSKQEGERIYRSRLQRIYNVMALVAIALAIVVTLASNPVIDFLYGSQYESAGRILAIHIWTCPAVFMGAVLSKWLIAEDLLIFSFTRHAIGAVANVLFNLLLIPVYGGVGAAVATLISYTCASYLACFTDPRTRVAGHMMTHALISPATALFRRA